MSAHDQSRFEILEMLRVAYPNGVASSALLERQPAAKTRIGELRDAGWKIVTSQMETGALYRLLALDEPSSSQKEAASKARGVEVGCKVIRRPGSRGFEVEVYGTASNQAESRAVAEQIRDLLNKLAVTPVLEDEEPFDFGGDLW